MPLVQMGKGSYGPSLSFIQDGVHAKLIGSMKMNILHIFLVAFFTAVVSAATIHPEQLFPNQDTRTVTTGETQVPTGTTAGRARSVVHRTYPAPTDPEEWGVRDLDEIVGTTIGGDGRNRFCTVS